MKYVVKIGNDYIYSIQIANGLLGKNNTEFLLCPNKKDALRFKHKYMAQAFAKLINGTVETINSNLFVV